VVKRYERTGVVLLLGAQETWTLVPWAALEEVGGALRTKGWMKVSGSGYSTDVMEGTIDGILKKYVSEQPQGG
jgi:hypothetical protein